ncbi:MAG: excinuclease ABC subunit UvrC [Deltaproteobacteria bacterium]|nr:excinuclease ABC subunit UvrC [Deltaproteobacteria bacterium]
MTSIEGRDDELTTLVAQKLETLPPSPGCYLLKDQAGDVVYVGKAKSLRSRVRSYFQDSSSDGRYFIPLLRRLVGDVETVVTASEKEASVLENELIKKHRPRFNVKLRDDKEFLCLRLDVRAEWPRLEPVRRPTSDGARYFGPYHSASGARRTLRLIAKHFQLRTCTDTDMRSRSRPCLQHQIKRCAAPCVYEVDREFYGEQVRTVELFLDGRHDELTKRVEVRMREAAGAFEYELAAMYRDQLAAVASVREGQRVVSVQKIDQDVLGLYREGDLVEVVVLQVRQGHVTDTQSFSLGRSELPDDELVAGFVGQYYAGESPVGLPPDEVLVPILPEAAEGLAAWLAELAGRRVRVSSARSGARRQLLDLASENAAHAFREKRRASDEVEARLEALQSKLRLPTLPRVIECSDISHLGGGDAVGSVVCMRDGALDKRRYRTFTIKTTADGDDYAAQYEVLARRFRRGRDAAAEEGDAWELPDLFVIDGGRGQLNVALAAARDLGLHDLTIVALAKERESPTGEAVVDRVYLPGQKNGIPLSATSALVLLARLRDEAHRFANHGRKKQGAKRTFRSELDGIAGIGPASRRALHATLGSMREIRAATDDAILAVPGITRRHLMALRAVIPRPEAARLEAQGNTASRPDEAAIDVSLEGPRVEPVEGRSAPGANGDDDIGATR